MAYLKSIAKLSILIVVVTCLYSPLKIAKAEAPVLTKQEIYQQKINQWVDKLAIAESNDDPNLVHLDVNRQYSYSCLQFQKSTWEKMSKKYGVQGDIMDCTKQKQLAVLMINNNYSAWENWWTSAKYKIGLPPKENI